jgi:hypothetical protein
VADRTVNVEFKVSGADAASRQVAGIGTAASESAKRLDALRAAQDRVAREIGGGSVNPASDVALTRLSRTVNRSAVDEEMARLDPDRAIRGGDDGPGGFGGFRRGLAGSGFSRAFMPLFLAHAAGQAIGGIGTGLKESYEGGLSPVQTLDAVFKKMGEGLPILGGFVRGMADLSDVLTGLSGARFEAARFAGVVGRGAAYQTHEAHLAASQAATLRPLLMAADQSAAQAAVEQQMLGLFGAPGAAGRYDVSRTDVRMGLATADAGRRRLAADRAAAEAAAAGGLVGGAAARAAADRAAAVAAGGIAGGFGATAQGSADAAFQAEQAVRHGGPGGAGWMFTAPIFGGAGGVRERRAVAARGTAQADAEASAAAAAQQLEALRTAGASRTALAEAQRDAARKQLEAQQAGLAAGPGEQLDLVRGRIDRAQAGALQAGMQSPLERQALLELARFAERTPEGLTPGQRQELVSDPTTGRFFQKKFAEMGAGFPAQQELEQRFGEGKPLGDLQAEEKRLEETMRKQNQEFLEGYRKVLAESYKGLLEDMGKVAKEEAEAARQKFKADQDIKQLQGK